MRYKDLTLFSCVFLAALITSAQNQAYELANSDATHGLISEFKLLGKGCETGTTINYDESTGITQLALSQLHTTINSEKKEDRTICLIKYTAEIPAYKQAIITPAIIKGNINISEYSKTTISVRYRYAGTVGPASIWEFNGTANGEVVLKKGLTTEKSSCGQPQYLKLSIVLESRSLDPNLTLTTPQTTTINEVLIPPITLEDCTPDSENI
ncbi:MULTISPECIES: DUF4360 domain-containing protein [Zooshikella]|uniref:DUF4360 domain-containing protein n=1 Tax=Zooshikella harenae TaxID=2827238 RepID=A0ABS5ZAP5_9GAMM|nr:DUF4360 domain-containing protein [Zooshikella harenae]MBU2711131.1 DUF4360 domain-containing protein [Zooshikella harenae]